MGEIYQRRLHTTDKNEQVPPTAQQLFVALISGGGQLLWHAKKRGISVWSISCFEIAARKKIKSGIQFR